MQLGVLVSGGGTNLQAILDATTDGRIAGKVAIVISDRPGVKALERADKFGVPNLVLRTRDYPDRDAYSAAVAQTLQDAGVEFVVLAGFLKILTQPMLDVYENRIINTHPALLPAFGGPGMMGLAVHQAVLDYGCKVSGCTVHLVSAAVDGGPVLEQEAVRVEQGDTAETLQARILPHEHASLVRVLGWFADHRVKIDGRRVIVSAADKDINS